MTKDKSTNDAAGRGQNIPKGALRVVVDSLPPSPAPTEEEKAEKEFDKRLKIGKTILEIFAFIGLIAYVCETHRANELTRIAQRPWMAVYLTDQLHWQVGQPILINFKLTNVGKTPARAVTGKFSILAFKQGEAAHFDFRQGEGASGGDYSGFIPPGDKVDSQTYLFRKNPMNMAENLSTELSGQVSTGKSYIIVRGEVSYIDADGRKHWLHYCNYPFTFPAGVSLDEGIFLTSQARSCLEYNDADTNP
jgi:hypothetical protein